MHKRQRAGLAALLLLLISDCVGSDADMARFLVAPGKYDLYTCPELIQQAKTNQQKRHKLEALMAKAHQEPSGQMVSTLVYRPDYLSTQGELRDLREAAIAKRCDLAQLEKALASPHEKALAGPDDNGGFITKGALPALR